MGPRLGLGGRGKGLLPQWSPNPIFGREPHSERPLECFLRGAYRDTVPNTDDTKSPERQGFCAKIPDNVSSERLPSRYAYISFGTVPRVPMSIYKEKFRVFPCGALFRV